MHQSIVRFFLFCLAVVLCQTVAYGQTVTAADFRFGVESGGFSTVLVEAFQVRGDRFIAPDVGFLHFGDPHAEREWLIGFGVEAVKTKRLIIINKLYYVHSDGVEAHGAKYLEPWMSVRYSFTPKFVARAEMFPHLPIGHEGHRQWVFERLELERVFSHMFKLGAGYGAFRTQRIREWQHSSFVATTVTPFGGRFGSLELWVQPGPQFQVRYGVESKRH